MTLFICFLLFPSVLSLPLYSHRGSETFQQEVLSDDLSIWEINQKAGVADMFEGDIMLTDEQKEWLKSYENGINLKDLPSSLYVRWPNNTVYYEFGENFATNRYEFVKIALKKLQDNTCLTFQENKTATNRIKVVDGKGCFSKLGMLHNRTQELILQKGCELTTAHEFIHALGFVHTQSRPDRDDHVSVDLTHVNENMTQNFKIKSGFKVYTPYEYGSVMHYSAILFTTSKKVSITPRDKNYMYTMGGTQLTITDYDMINILYGCHDNCPPEKSAKCVHKGFPNPNNCSKCVCPDGYGGDLCDQRPDDSCGETLVATDKWQEREYEFKNDGHYTIHKHCTSWVTTDANHEIQVKLVSMPDKCIYGCNYWGVEFKIFEEKLTNPRICCKQFINTTYTSALNPTPVIMYTLDTKNSVKFAFKFKRIPISNTTTMSSAMDSTSTS